jgi:hypothetical protein
MFWFINAGVLVGLVSVAIPIIIHLLKINRREQSVPSLLLFTALKKIRRNYRLRKILLLLLRIAVLIFLIFLLAKPYIQRRLNSLNASAGEKVLMAAVIDDGISSFVTLENGVSAFEYAKTQLLERIKKLSKDSAVIIAGSSSRVASDVLSPEEAIDIITRMNNVPVSGSLAEALKNVSEKMRKISDFSCGGIVVAAPGAAKLWQGIKHTGDIPFKIVAIDNMVLKPCRLFIKKVEINNDNGRVKIILGGDASLSNGVKVVLRDLKDHKFASSLVSLDDAVKGMVEFSPEKLAGRDSFSAELEGTNGKNTSPLNSYYLARAGRDSKKSIIILYDNSKISGIYAQIIYVALKASLPASQAELTLINIKRELDKLRLFKQPDCVFIPPLEYSENISKWLAGIVDVGARIIFFPGTSKYAAELNFGHEKVFAGAKVLKNAEVLKLHNSPGLDKRFLHIYASGLSKVKLDKFYPVAKVAGLNQVFSCGGYPVLSVSGVDSGRNGIFCGIPLTSEAISLLANPLFPGFLRLLATGGNGDGKAENGKTFVNFDAASMLGVGRGSGTLLPPDGKELKINFSKQKPQNFYFEQSGFYRFFLSYPDQKTGENKERLVLKAFNFPRPSGNFLSPDEFRKTYAFAGNIAGENQTVSWGKIPRLAEEESESEVIVKQDLTPWVALALWLLLMLELIVSGAWNYFSGVFK